MSKQVRWQIPFVSRLGTAYRVDIYDEGYTGSPVQLIGGTSPFVTDESDSDDYFAPIRVQTGTLTVCTHDEDGNVLITLDDILPASNISRPVYLVNVGTGAVEWQGFLSCEAYSQDYTSIPQHLQLPVISVLEAMRSVELSSYWLEQNYAITISAFISVILDQQVYNDLGMQVTAVYSDTCTDFLSKYIFATQFFTYDTNEASGEVTYLYKATFLYDILERICKFMGWCLREIGSTFYFTRIGSDVSGQTTIDMDSLEWLDTDHKRTVSQGAKSVSVEANVEEFKTYFEFPQCPIAGLSQKNIYGDIISLPLWYYDKCTQTSVLGFVSSDISKAFLARFYGVRSDSTMPWNTLYEEIGFENVIYLVGKAYSDTTYAKYCTIRSAQEFSCVCGVENTNEDAGYFVLKIKEEVSAQLKVNGYIRCGIRFMGLYYSGASVPWANNPSLSIKVELSNGSGEVRIPIPKMGANYTFASSDIEVYLYDDFDNTKTSALISEVSIDYEPPFRKYKDPQSTNRYAQNIQTEFRDEISVSLELASNFANVNGLSHIYGIKRYTYGQEYVDYIEPITTLTYTKPDSTTETRRPEVDLLSRLATYYGAARQRLDLIVEHPTTAPLPLLRLNGISPDSRTYAPLAESRDWQQDSSTIKCFEMI